MTCVVALKLPGDDSVWMGCDSLAGDGYNNRITRYPKIFSIGDLTIGYTTSFRMAQLIQFNLKICEQKEDEPALQYLVARFIPAVRECLSDGGFTRIEDNQETGGEFIVVYQRDIYLVASDFQVNPLDEPFVAIGAGEQYALGAMASLAIQGGISPKEIVNVALHVAARFSSYVCPPFRIYEINK